MHNKTTDQNERPQPRSDTNYAAEVAERIIAGLPTYSQVERGESFGRALATALRAAGYVDLESTSTCKTATYEALLGNGTTEVEIRCAVFMGVFTAIHVFPQTHQPTGEKKGRGKR